MLSEELQGPSVGGELVLPSKRKAKGPKAPPALTKEEEKVALHLSKKQKRKLEQLRLKKEKVVSMVVVMVFRWFL